MLWLTWHRESLWAVLPSNGYTAQSLAGISGNWLILAALDEKETTQPPCQLYPLRQVSLTSAMRKQPSHCLGTLQSGRLKDLYKVRVCKQRPHGATGCLVSLPMRHVICCILRFCTVFFLALKIIGSYLGLVSEIDLGQPQKFDRVHEIKQMRNPDRPEGLSKCWAQSQKTLELFLAS